MNLIKIEKVKNTYPEPIEGTQEWFSCSECVEPFCDLYEAEEIVKSGAVFQGVTQHLVHFPDGQVYSLFPLKKNVYVERPVWNNDELFFESVDFEKRVIDIYGYKPSDNRLRQVDQIGLDEVTDCYNLKLEVSPLMLGRSGNDGFYEIIWPQRKKIAIGETEGVCFRDGDKLYCSAWVEDPYYHEMSIIRDINTGEIISKKSGTVCRLSNNVFWEID